tara:strand:+ start:428 stop:670 length:243 start_codon:yes stop_codon:yes gene_type:complete
VIAGLYYKSKERDALALTAREHQRKHLTADDHPVTLRGREGSTPHNDEARTSKKMLDKPPPPGYNRRDTNKECGVTHSLP